MRRLAHISDLHFNRIDPGVAEALAVDLHDQKPDLLIGSGDFTQRARVGQYEAAAAYLQRLPTPQLLIPGNHDIPLFNPIRRFFFPLVRYRRHISRDVRPFHHDEQIAVLGINTARPWAWRMKGFWKDGSISEEQLLDVKLRLGGLGPEVFKIVVTHHPFIPPPGERLHGIVGEAQRALDMMESCGVDLLLAGHLHLGYSGDVRTHHEAVKRSILSVQAGTAISTRRREETNAYNLITIEPDRVIITVREWTRAGFMPGVVTTYHRRDGVWEQEQFQTNPKPQ